MPLVGWGSNSCGQLGSGDNIDYSTFKHISIPPDIKVTQIAGSGNHSILLCDDGKIFSSGKNNMFQLCRKSGSEWDGTFKNSDICEKVKYIACGWDVTVLVFDNQVTLYGTSLFNNALHYTDYQDLNKNIVNVLVPSESKNDAESLFDCIVSCDVGRCHLLLLSESGKVYSWGIGKKGQLGLALHEVYAWGCNKFGQCGFIGETSVFQPRKIHLNDTIYEISCGWSHVFAMTGTSKIYCWGRNDFGQCARSTHPCLPDLVNVNLEHCKIACGAEHTLIYDTVNPIILSTGWNEHGSCISPENDFIRSFHSIPLIFIVSNFSKTILASGYGHSFFYFTEV
ncbi:hypothetical protein MXB_5085 [Myxobolus squamalis]|nr:hypothetical protein MXB_5085 [Myxobolus squamalis]